MHLKKSGMGRKANTERDRENDMRGEVSRNVKALKLK